MTEFASNNSTPQKPIDPLLNPNPDPWEDTETAHLRAFLKLTYSERFHLLMDAIEFMHMLRPPTQAGITNEPVTDTDSAFNS